MRLPLWCLLLALLSACASSYSLTQPDFRPAEIPAMLLGPPVSTIATIERGNRGMVDDEASQESVYLLRQLLLAHKPELRLRGELVVPDSLRRAAAQEISEAVLYPDGSAELPHRANLPILDSLLRQQGQRYVLVPVAQGFTRMAGKYGVELVKSIGVSLLTFGLARVAAKAESEITIFIYDGQQHIIVYFRRTRPAKREPLDDASVEKQLQQLLGRDFTFIPQL